MNKKGLLSQKGLVVWLFGLSGSGKTTISSLLQEKLQEEGFFVMSLDGDVLRAGINSDLSFTEIDREENIRRAAEIAKIMLQNDIVTICSFITPLKKHRAQAANIIGECYLEVFVDCPISVCESRDVKGLYKKAQSRQITNFTGISSGFEAPVHPQLTIHTDIESPEESMEKVYRYIISFIKA
ncbi:adenylyl-sulfate kinase [Mucilaginibacter sabulilitoris]|uniref:Adenylyl-sulfate kinase n=1 Tax=Mucilaginibacter sabulilitoris TaxID=1173583 RepID=A0ABZ0TVJ4_9SPHI|nr:adenylyl-sulfate kinase [Mucilaginibacter sabulilitoris]WPU96078.1 adenylyl-sulfate kinase [Mucilaginibacter sabulilitoris]